MTVINSHGQLFGRVNLVDAAAAILVVALTLLGSVAYRVVRVQPPLITGVAPSTLTGNDEARLRLSGRHFRPLLNAFVTRSGGPPSAGAVLPVQFLIGSPTVAELKLPALEPGTYDIHLFDGAREVAWRQSAFTMSGRPAPHGS